MTTLSRGMLRELLSRVITTIRPLVEALQTLDWRGNAQIKTRFLLQLEAETDPGLMGMTALPPCDIV